MSKSIKFYVGYDSREDIAWQVCRHSMRRHSASTLEIHRLAQSTLRELGLYTRPADQATTEFSLTRFLTPYIAAHEGWSVFMDCDFLWTADVMALRDHLDDSKAIMTVKHDYVPAAAIKMDGQVQTTYPRKNWSSFMVFNGAHPAVQALTPEIVNSAAPSYLHRLNWVDDDLIGELPLTWNFLEGEYPAPVQPPKAIHYTNGGPWFSQCQDVAYAREWLAEAQLYQASLADRSAA